MMRTKHTDLVPRGDTESIKLKYRKKKEDNVQLTYKELLVGLQEETKTRAKSEAEKECERIKRMAATEQTNGYKTKPKQEIVR